MEEKQGRSSTQHKGHSGKNWLNLVHACKPHKKAVTAMAVDQEGKLLASGVSWEREEGGREGWGGGRDGEGGREGGMGEGGREGEGESEGGGRVGGREGGREERKEGGGKERGTGTLGVNEGEGRMRGERQKERG